MDADGKIGSLVQFVEAVNAIVLKDAEPLELKKLLFRGQSRKDFALVPSLGRSPSLTGTNGCASVEDALVRFAQQKFPQVFPDSDYPVVLLAKLQHYGVRTRMLDLTGNALVALYFACNQDSDADGEVFAFQEEVLSAYDVLSNIVADTYRLTENKITHFNDYYYRVMHRPYAVRLLHAGWENNVSFVHRLFSEAMRKPLFVEVGNVCERQRSQSGKFILFPNKMENGRVKQSLLSLEKDDECIVKRLIIQKEAKEKILSQLVRFGITSETLFPDNIDRGMEAVVAEQLQRYATPGNEQ